MTQLARTTDVALQHGDWQVMKEQAAMLVKTGFLPETIRTPEQAVAIMLKGRELQLPPMYALSNIVVIKGKPVASAELLQALVYRDHGDNAMRIKQTDATVCTIEYRRRSWSHPETYSFTIEDAKAAGLTGNQTWQKYPQAMLRARCISAVARMAFADSIGGMYTPEEMGAAVNGEGEIVGSTTEVGDVSPVTPHQPDRRAKIINRIRQVERELIALNPQYEPYPDDGLGELDEQALLGYGNQLRVWIDDAKQPQVTPIAISDGEIRFWSRWGGFVGGTEWERIRRELGEAVEQPTDDAGWDALSERMDEHAAKTVQE